MLQLNIPDRPGVYTLVLCLSRDAEIITKAKMFSLREGLYVYVGSAFNGLRRRILRYIRGPARKHWHIDYLLDKAILLALAYSVTSQREPRPETLLSRELSKMTDLFEPVPGFGCSDVRGVKSNLYRYRRCDLTSLLGVLAEIMRRLFGNVQVMYVRDSQVEVGKF